MTETPVDLQGLPAEALTRLHELEETPEHPAMFTSDLSVNEFLLVQEAGFEPVGLVVGSSIYHVGIQLARWKSSRELEVLTQAMYHARELAMSRMEAEAEALGADGIVGVRLDNFVPLRGQFESHYDARATARARRDVRVIRQLLDQVQAEPETAAVVQLVILDASTRVGHKDAECPSF